MNSLIETKVSSVAKEVATFVTFVGILSSTTDQSGELWLFPHSHYIQRALLQCELPAPKGER